VSTFLTNCPLSPQDMQPYDVGMSATLSCATSPTDTSGHGSCWIRLGDLGTPDPYERLRPNLYQVMLRGLGRPSLFPPQSRGVSLFAPTDDPISQQDDHSVRMLVYVRTVIDRMPQSETDDFTTHVRSQLAEWGILDEVRQAKRRAGECYRSLKATSVHLDNDPEIPGRTMVRIELTVSGHPVDVLDDEDRFKHAVLRKASPAFWERFAVAYRWSEAQHGTQGVS